MADHTEFIGRKLPGSRYKPASKFDRRLKTLNRPVPTQEVMLPADTPASEFISRSRTSPA